MKNDESTTDQQSKIKLDESQVLELIKFRIGESESFWNDKDYKLKTTSENNEKYYLGKQVSGNDDGEEELSLDNRIFSSVRTIVPYVTSRITEPEVYPSSSAQAAKKFAEDFEKALYIKAKMEKVREKVKFALEDAIIRRRGYLKPRYDLATGNFCAVEYVPCESIIVDHKAKPYEELRYFRHTQDKSVSDLLTMFPEKKKEIQELFGVDDTTPTSKLEEAYTINEDWQFVSGEDGLDLLVCWNYKDTVFGLIQDPNWNYDGVNVLDQHMMPLVPINILNDGRTHVDKTSFVEQAKYSQDNVDLRSRQISQNAGLGTVGMPVVAANALADDQADFLKFEGDTVLVLDLKNSGASSIREVFDVWKSGALPNFVFEDKLDSRNAIDNAFGTPNVFRGEQSDNNTLGQDVLVRDQAFGRQQEIVDAIDSAMSRLYLLMAQFLLVYGEEEELFRFVGEDGQFDYILMNTEGLDTNVLVQVKAGTSMPVDRAQRRATANKAAEMKMIDPLTYWEIMDEGNAEKYTKRLMDFTTDPAKYMKDTDDEVFNRDAFVDIELIKQGQQPPFRNNLDKEYFDHLNRYILSGDLDDPEIPMPAKAAITQFIDAQLLRGQKMLGMAETQLPTPEEVTAANQGTDQLNQSDQQAAEQEAKQAQSQAKAPPAAQEAAPIPVQ